MAWTVTKTGNIIQLTPDGSTDFVWSTYFPSEPEGVLLDQVSVYVSAANDIVCMRNGSTTGAKTFVDKAAAVTALERRLYRKLLKPVFVHTEQTYSTAANWVITLQTVGS